MNNQRDPYPVLMTKEHINRLPSVVRAWGDSDNILSLSGWTRGPKPDNITIVDIIRVLELPDAEVRIPYPDDKFKYIICIGVLEYIRNPWDIVEDMYRVLQPGGQIYVEVPFLQPYDPTNGDYFRFTPSGLRQLFNKFDVEELGIANGPGSAMFWLTRIYEALKFDRDGAITDLVSKIGEEDYSEAYRIFGMANEYLKETDEELSSKEHATLIACSYYALVTKAVGGDEGMMEDTELRIQTDEEAT